MANDIFLGIGSNKGDKDKFILQAVGLIDKNEKCEVVKCSSIYETTPSGKVDQANFLNTVIQIESSYEPAELFAEIKAIEMALGRESTVRWGPREIDVDILFYNSLIYNSNDLVIPHPEIIKRDFVIVPMLEIAPDYEHPLLKMKMKNFDLSAVEPHIIRKTNFQIN